MDEPSRAPRRSYDNSVRRRKAEQTRERIVSAGSELVHGFDNWDWRGLTFRAVAERASVGERTVYRHFPTERHLHAAVMQRLETEAGVSYEDVTLENLGAVTGRVFASLQRFSVRETFPTPSDPAFVRSDERRRQALMRVVADAAPGVPEERRRRVAGLLDVLWSPAAYERLVGVWALHGDDAASAIDWAMTQVVQALDRDDNSPA